MCVRCVYPPVTESSYVDLGVPALFLQPCLRDALPGVLLIQGCQNEEREGICEYHLWFLCRSRPSMTSFRLICLSAASASSCCLLIFILCVAIRAVREHRNRFKAEKFNIKYISVTQTLSKILNIML